MSHYQRVAGKIRWWLLVAVLICWLAGIFWVFNIAWPHWRVFSNKGNHQEMAYGWGLQGVMGLEWQSEWSYLLFAGTVAGLFFVSQWFFLRPSRGWRIRLDDNGRPLRLSVWIGGLMAALLSLGLLATAAELIGVWDKLMVVHHVNAVRGPEMRYWPALAALAALWALWALVFFLYWYHGDRGTQLGRMLRGLFAGSILELLVAAPVHVMILRSKSKGQCYCETGSYTGLVLGGTVLLWTFGPGIVLLFLREIRRRRPLLENMAKASQSPPE
ncbi:MAG: hypothetical protein ACP5VQ_04920 [Phycisphaerae bacterium]